MKLFSNTPPKCRYKAEIHDNGSFVIRRNCRGATWRMASGEAKDRATAEIEVRRLIKADVERRTTEHRAKKTIVVDA